MTPTMTTQGSSTIKNYYTRFAQISRDLEQGGEFVRDRVVYITSLDVPEREIVADRVCQATVSVAARCIASRTHRPSTSGEIDRFHIEQEERALACFAESMRNKEKTVLAMTPEFAKQLGMVQGFQNPQPAAEESSGSRVRRGKGE